MTGHTLFLPLNLLIMDVTNVSLAVSFLAIVIALLTFFKKEKKAPETDGGFSARPLQLQAYERLALLCERIAIPSLVSRVNQPNFSAREMQVFLIESIKQEYEYNASQQVYVSTSAWNAVRNLRDQNMLVINQIANLLPAEATASELNRKLLEVMIQDQNVALHTMALDTLNKEAKELMR